MKLKGTSSEFQREKWLSKPAAVTRAYGEESAPSGRGQVPAKTQGIGPGAPRGDHRGGQGFVNDRGFHESDDARDRREGGIVPDRGLPLFSREGRHSQSHR